VRHRFLLAEAAYELPPGLLRLLVHVLHPEVVECFKNHQLRVSRFGLWTRQETVVVHITLRSWAIKPKGSEFCAIREDDKIHLPPDLVRSYHNPSDMELKVSSIGMSTNEFGDFSKCSIISDLLQEKDINELGERAQEIWDGFTHQPQTGRFVVFSVVLGLLCQEMVANYNGIMDDFLKNTQLEQQLVTSHSLPNNRISADSLVQPSYLQNPAKLQERDADAELRLSLWNLEALYKLNNTVSASVKTIEGAITDINRQVEEVGRSDPNVEPNIMNLTNPRDPEREARS